MGSSSYRLLFEPIPLAPSEPRGLEPFLTRIQGRRESERPLSGSMMSVRYWWVLEVKLSYALGS